MRYVCRYMWAESRWKIDTFCYETSEVFHNVYGWNFDDKTKDYYDPLHLLRKELKE